MVQPVTEDQILQASYPDPPQLITSKTPISRLDSKIGRAYYERGVEESKRTYIYSSTTILSNTLTKGIGFSMWLGNSISYEHAKLISEEKDKELIDKANKYKKSLSRKNPIPRNYLYGLWITIYKDSGYDFYLEPIQMKLFDSKWKSAINNFFRKEQRRKK